MSDKILHTIQPRLFSVEYSVEMGPDSYATVVDTCTFSGQGSIMLEAGSSFMALHTMAKKHGYTLVHVTQSFDMFFLHNSVVEQHNLSAFVWPVTHWTQNTSWWLQSTGNRFRTDYSGVQHLIDYQVFTKEEEKEASERAMRHNPMVGIVTGIEHGQDSAGAFAVEAAKKSFANQIYPFYKRIWNNGLLLDHIDLVLPERPFYIHTFNLSKTSHELNRAAAKAGGYSNVWKNPAFHVPQTIWEEWIATD